MNSYKTEKSAKYILVIGLILLTNSCKKLVDVDGPTTSISGKNVYTSDASAISVLTGIYTVMSQSGITTGDLTSIGFLSGQSSDELTLFSGNTDNRLLAYYQNMLSSSIAGGEIWTNSYSKLYIVNSAIEALSKPGSLSEKVRTQLLGEAKFIRALCYFYLVNLYGDVPMITSSNYLVNIQLPRSSKSLIWELIITDLIDAQSLLSSNYPDATLLSNTSERIRPNKWAATALLSRTYLYLKDWKDAELQATSIINQTSLYKLSDTLNGVFKKNNAEAIWQLQPVLSGWNTEDAKSYIIPAQYGPNGVGGVSLSDQLLTSFEPNDQRKNKWIDTVSFEGILYFYAYKYKVNKYGDEVTEYNTILRLGEQYLIRAEARVMQNNIEGARDDLNLIRKRAGLQNTQATTQTILLTAILHERQVELFTEWGHRWLDLKRSNTVNNIMSLETPRKGGKWNTNWQLYPIPLYDIQTDNNIIQNTGY